MSFGFGLSLPAYPLRGGGGNNPFNQLGPTLDLSFAGTVTDLSDPNGYTLNTNFITPQYQIAAQYLVWELGVGLVDKTFSQIITFTRASTATYFNSAGVLQSAAIDVPRFDYNPATLAAQGLLIEEQRTNIVASSVYTANANAWTNGVIGGTGTITAAAVNSPAGTTAGVFNINGLNGSSYVGVFPAVTASANARTGSVFVRNNGGVKFQIRLIFQTGGTFVSYGTEYDFTTTAFQDGIAGTTAPTSRSVTNVGNGWLRITITGSDNGTGNTQASLQFWGAVTTTNYNYLMWGAQIEEAAAGASAAFPTSYIPTTTTALTRSADVASVNTLSPWFNASASTLYAEVLLANLPPSGTFPTYVSLNDGSTNNFISLSSNGFANHRVTDRSGGVPLWDANAGGSIVAGTPSKWALAVASGDQAGCANGGAVLTNSTAGLPTGINAMRLGAQFTGAGVTGAAWLRRVTYYPRRLSNAELQAITA